MKKVLLLIAALLFSLSSFADSSSICEKFKLQIEERETALATTEKVVDETQIELSDTIEALEILENKYRRRKSIWIPVAVLSGVGAVVAGVKTISSISSGGFFGPLGGIFIGIPSTIGLTIGAFAAKTPISITKKELEEVTEAFIELEERLAEYKGACEQLSTQVEDLKLTYELNCQ